VSWSPHSISFAAVDDDDEFSRVGFMFKNSDNSISDWVREAE